ncbi:MAG: sulfite exporter TauE/SafE family protein [Desulfovibrio sp.]|nr:sulfite exporter TauE/SafE family protein [Desulfovibrio sp.]MBI4958885.1 sulfite exporter TauE/SafE family protein [Desulfovibrio sp.]
MSRKRAIVAMVMLCLVMASYYVPFGQAQDQKPAPAQAAPAADAAGGLSLSVDKASLSNGGEVTVSGKTQPGKPVYIEVANESKVRAVFFDDRPDKEGKRPYKLYLTQDLPAFYQIYTPTSTKEVFEKFKAQGRKFPYSDALKELGADVAYSVPAKIAIDAYQTSFMASILGSRGDKLATLDPQENKRRSMQLVKARFRTPGKLLSPTVQVQPDGSYTCKVKIPDGSAPGKYTITAFSDKDLKSKPVVVDNAISFPVMYMSGAGTSLNVFWPFLLTLGIGIFGVLMGAGGGFLLNPILLSIWPALPHTIVAGTVTPTVLFSQMSGVYNYTKIKFISWKLGIIMGLAMAAGGFIGPKLTELITLDQFKFVFGIILLILAALMLWQTTPGYLERNKKEQAILKEFKKRAEESAKAKG